MMAPEPVCLGPRGRHPLRTLRTRELGPDRPAPRGRAPAEPSSSPRSKRAEASLARRDRCGAARRHRHHRIGRVARAWLAAGHPPVRVCSAKAEVRDRRFTALEVPAKERLRARGTAASWFPLHRDARRERRTTLRTLSTRGRRRGANADPRTSWWQSTAFSTLSARASEPPASSRSGGATCTHGRAFGVLFASTRALHGPATEPEQPISSPPASPPAQNGPFSAPCGCHRKWPPCRGFLRGERGDSNPRPPGPQPGALPAELRPPSLPIRV
jgi:hypothetical protein